MNCNNQCNPCKCGVIEGERRKQDAFATLTANREAVIRRAQRALLTVLLETGSATADNVREQVELPAGINAKCFGAVPSPLARAGIIRADGFAKTCRPIGHARPVTVWALADRAAAERWLRNHPDMPDPDEGEGVAVSQRVLFPTNTANEPTPTAATIGAGMEQEPHDSKITV
jgi:hypothetical protein